MSAGENPWRQKTKREATIFDSCPKGIKDIKRNAPEDAGNNYAASFKVRDDKHFNV